MNKKYLLALAVAFAVPVLADNVALGKPVTITGDVGVITCCWPDATVYPPAPLSSITDGVSLTEQTEWQDGTVWWDEFWPGSADNIIEINLNGLYRVTSVLIQADNNDVYGISYRDAVGNWAPLFNAPGIFPGFGMMTRTAPVGPVDATAFRIDASGGDAFYSVSEFQAQGTAVPEPSAWLAIAAGFGLIVFKRRVKQ